MSQIVGRVANRIEGGKFKIDGEEYQVSVNENGNTLHGGQVGFDKAVWDVVDYVEGESVTLRLVSKDGDQGFPGEVTATVEYRLTKGTETDKGLLLVNMSAVTTKATPISLAQHSYFNLALGGHASRADVLKTKLHLNAEHYTPVNDKLIPTGELRPTKQDEGEGKGSFHFPEDGVLIGKNMPPGGYDHNFILSQDVGRRFDRLDIDASLHLAAILEDTESGRKIELSTSAPGVQFYSGNFLDGSITAAQGTKADARYDEPPTYNKYNGLCLETQGFPNAINQPNFPTNLVRPGEKYNHVMVYKFS